MISQFLAVRNNKGEVGIQFREYETNTDGKIVGQTKPKAIPISEIDAADSQFATIATAFSSDLVANLATVTSERDVATQERDSLQTQLDEKTSDLETANATITDLQKQIQTLSLGYDSRLIDPRAFHGRVARLDNGGVVLRITQTIRDESNPSAKSIAEQVMDQLTDAMEQRESDGVYRSDLDGELVVNGLAALKSIGIVTDEHIAALRADASHDEQ